MTTRAFKAEDGTSWVARIHDGVEIRRPLDERAGWEVVQFDPAPPAAVQRITYRPAGWLANASIQDLIKALQEGETVRTSWR
jgi:hypothetical protein